MFVIYRAVLPILLTIFVLRVCGSIFTFHFILRIYHVYRHGLEILWVTIVGAWNIKLKMLVVQGLGIFALCFKCEFSFYSVPAC